GRADTEEISQRDQFVALERAAACLDARVGWLRHVDRGAGLVLRDLRGLAHLPQPPAECHVIDQLPSGHSESHLLDYSPYAGQSPGMQSADLSTCFRQSSVPYFGSSGHLPGTSSARTAARLPRLTAHRHAPTTAVVFVRPLSLLAGRLVRLHGVLGVR